MDEILKYFPNLSEIQITQFQKLGNVYEEWNSKINVISRKDIDSLYIRHVLHSLAIAKVIGFTPGTSVLDVGTGGGFPGIPLAILFPEVNFHLIDVIGKKITVVQAVADELQLSNVHAEQIRAEGVSGKYDFVVSRAVTNMTDFVSWVSGKLSTKQRNAYKNGIFYLKGGDLSDELANFPQARTFEISEFFDNDFFETKKVVYLKV